jgi:large subunit ribosomal protein L25
MTITLAVTNRDTSKKTATLRTEGQVPGVVYGPKQKGINLVVDGKQLEKVLKEAGESSIIELEGLGSKIEVLVKGVEFDPVRRAIQHVDFYAIELGKDMTVVIPLEFVGISPAEKNGIGVVTHALQEIEVTCQPSNLPQHIDVDISTLVDADSKITIADLIIPAGVIVENEPTETVAVVSIIEDEVEPVNTIDMSAIAVEKKGKEEVAP